MRHAAIVVWWVLLGASPAPVWAAGVYTCRDAGGANIYQDVPCTAGQHSVSHRAIEAPAPQPVSAPDDAREETRPRRRRSDAPPAQRAARASGHRQSVLAYECRAVGRTWTQLQPCATRALEVSTSGGRRAAGVTAGARASERALGRRELCEKVRDGSFRDPAGTRPSDDVYQRNLMRDRGC